MRIFNIPSGGECPRTRLVEVALPERTEPATMNERGEIVPGQVTPARKDFSLQCAGQEAKLPPGVASALARILEENREMRKRLRAVLRAASVAEESLG